jgi:hypothetical protein
LLAVSGGNVLIRQLLERAERRHIMKEYYKVYRDTDAMREEISYLRKALPDNVTGDFFRDIPVLDLRSEHEIDFEAYGSAGWRPERPA